MLLPQRMLFPRRSAAPFLRSPAYATHPLYPNTGGPSLPMRPNTVRTLGARGAGSAAAAVQGRAGAPRRGALRA